MLFENYKINPGERGEQNLNIKGFSNNKQFCFCDKQIYNYATINYNSFNARPELQWNKTLKYIEFKNRSFPAIINRIKM